MASLGTWPASIRPRTCRFVPVTNQRVNSAPGAGSEQVIDMLNDRWTVYLTLAVRKHADAAAIEAFINSFRGQVNTVDLWHFTRPQITGTFTGTLVTSGTQAQGAASVVVSGGNAGGTVQAGDMIGVGGQILMVSGAATANGSGVITIPVVNRLRAAVSNGQAVTTIKPTAPFRLLSSSGVTYVPGFAEEVTLTLGEAIA